MRLAVEQFSTRPFASLNESMDSLVGCLRLVVPFRLWMVTRVSGDDWSVLFADDKEGEVKQGAVFRWCDSFCSRMVQNQGPRFATQAQSVIAYRNAPINNHLKIGAYIGQPLMSDEGVLLGTLCAVDPAESDSFTATQVQIVESITRTISTLLSVWLKWDRSRQVESKLNLLAHTDALTGLANRHAWNLLIAEENMALQKLGENALVMILDLDGLKEVNDTFGHATGDDYLVNAAKVLQAQFRDGDMVARIGGDEFAVFIRSRTKEYATILIKRVKTALALCNVDASIGISSYLSHGCLEKTICDADRKMYEEKTEKKRSRLPLAAR